MFYNVNNICKQPTEIGLVVWGGGGCAGNTHG